MNKFKLLMNLVLFCSLGMLSCAQNSTTSKTAKQQKPNIIYILADDMGYGDVGVYGQTKIKTPNIDKMANEGLKFTNHYSGQTVCSPSRCSLMTGMHMGNASVKRNGELMDPNDVTVAELLKPAGYKTGIIGKWGLSEGALADNSPNQQGFDHYFGFENQGFAHFYYPEYLWRNHTKVEYPENLNIRDEQGRYIKGKGTYSHDEFAKEALQFIKDNKSEPFFLYLPFAIPHAELTVPEDSKTQYRELKWPEVPKLIGGGGGKDSGYGSQYVDGYCAQDEPNITYAAMISRMDKNIGRIFDLLDELNIAENTIIMFASDNGPSYEGGQDTEFFNSAGGLRGHKRDVYEGGIRIPFIVKWKGHVKEGGVSNLPSAFWDFLPTVCDLTGLASPKNVDGISLLPTILGKTEQQRKHNYLYWEWNNNPYYQALRVDNWKFFKITPKDTKMEPYYELYNLADDISESNNMVSQHPELVEKFIPFIKEAQSQK
ncbi:arylsulfatase [Mariniflexile sp. AS56]|uniref:arylsulfatase n=1 Tax=Mariniflexile sp. AS56 TaxID=3063957 RepID=UPI0026EF4E8D|nr:arylsulfatase [Mariniflexile sp. AS56]MDO7173148.1 arylsulfatase [Mariniflexile sp. AS56]